MNFKIVNAKNLKIEFEKLLKNMVYLFTDIFIISSGKQRYKRGFVKKKTKKQGNKIKDSGEAYDIN